MFTISNLNKYYNLGKANEFHALKDINIKFPSKGFVFLLGKSGSGKSTLLNIIGGLDSFDDGVITVKDTSSKHFGKGAWDSFRNTYVGFIFQDYSIIDEYSVGKNIEVVLELQGVKKSEAKEKALQLIKAVDLPEETAKKKPNEISGGQKQRIAIARALVKNPEVILADEPTGALDSKTSEQILGILRRIANERLVIMVSHDRDAAMKYADQIIEMSDGQIVDNHYNESGLKLIGKNADYYKSDSDVGMVLRIPKNQKLSRDQIEKINTYLDQNSATLYVPLNKDCRITDKSLNVIYQLSSRSEDDLYLPIAKGANKIHGTRDPASATKENPAKASLNSDRGHYDVIKSRLPIGNSIKMGASSLWRRKFKSIFSIVIFLAAITIFGLVETVNKFDYGKALAKSYDTAGITQVTVTNTRNSSSKYEDRGTSFFTNEEYLEIAKSNSSLAMSKSYNFYSSYSLSSSGDSALVGATEIIGSTVISDLSLYRLELITGSLPSNANEIVVTDYTADALAGLVPGNTDTADYSTWLASASNITLGSTTVTIVGVVETGYEDYLYLNSLSEPEFQISDNVNAYNNFTTIASNILNRVIVSDDFQSDYLHGKYSSTNVQFGVQGSNEWPINISDNILIFSSIYSGENTQYMYIHDNFKSEIDTRGDLADNQIVLDEYSFGDWSFTELGYTSDQYLEYQGKTIDEKLDYLVSIGLLTEDFKLQGKIAINNSGWTETTDYVVVGIANTNWIANDFINIDQYQYLLTTNGVSYEQISMQDMMNYYGTSGNGYANYTASGGTLSEPEFSSYGVDNGYLYNLLESNGIEFTKANDNLWNGFFVSDNTYTSNSFYADGNISGIFVNLSDDISVNEKFFNYSEENGISNASNTVGFFIDMFYNVSTELSSIFIWVSIGIAGFAALLLFLNISNSVIAKTNDIGTLRAIGARGSDVSRIFVFEGLIVGILTFILSTTSLYLITSKLNGELQDSLGLQLSLFNPNMIILLEMFALAIGVVLLASWLPVKRVSRMKPIDAIKSIN